MKSTKRSTFTGKLGYLMAVAGSAVGLGNIWRFPYLAAKYGGGIFLLIYIILSLTFGFTLIIAETAIGRKTGKSAISAYRDLSQKHGFIGTLNGIIPMLIVPYYCVIGGWVIKYFATYLMTNGIEASKDGYFSSFVSDVQSPLIWFFLFVLATFVVVLMGVQKGIEKVSKIMMPILAVLSVFIALFSITRPGALAGLKYYLVPEFSNFSYMTIFAAMGQMFYSLSIAMGILVAYGSYMHKDIDMEKSVKQIEIFDIAIAFIAGLMIIPAVFSFSGGSPEALNAGPSLMFVTLPKVFANMYMGRFIGCVFFLLVLFAALTSAISLMEASISAFIDRFSLSRKKSCIIMGIITLLIGIPCSLGFGVWDHILPLGMSILDFFDFITNSVFMPIAALLTCYFVAYVLKNKPIIDEVKISSAFRREKLFTFTIRYFAPICIILILVSKVLSLFGIIKE